MDSMQSQNNYKSNFRTNKLTYTSMILGVLVAFLGIAGWTYNLESLKILLPNQITVKANSAIGMLICGISIAILSCRFSSKLLKHTLSSVITLYILIILLTLLEYILQLNFGIDQFLFTDVENTLNPGRMSPTTAFCFLNIYVALLFGVQTVIFYLRRPIVVALSMSVLFIAGMNFLSHIPNNLLGTTLLSYTHMGIPTALAFIMMASFLMLMKSEGDYYWALNRATTIGCILLLLTLFATSSAFFRFINLLKVRDQEIIKTQQANIEVNNILTSLLLLDSNLAKNNSDKIKYQNIIIQPIKTNN